MTLIQFYYSMAQAVNYMPGDAARPCGRLNAFRVLQKSGGLDFATDSETLGATIMDANGPFFYSRKWAAMGHNPSSICFDYPLLTAFELYSERQGMECNAKRCYKIQLAVIDQYKPDNCKTFGAGCEHRTVNQIQLDTQRLLDAVLCYMGGLLSVRYTIGADTIAAVLHAEKYAAIRAANPTLVEVSKENVGKKMTEYNGGQKMLFKHLEMPNVNLYGSQCEIVFCEAECEVLRWDFTEENWPAASILDGSAHCC